jgi:hypothetical protein
MGDDYLQHPEIESYTPGLQVEDRPQRDPADVDVNVSDDDVYDDGDGPEAPDRSMVQQESQETSNEDEVSE